MKVFLHCQYIYNYCLCLTEGNLSSEDITQNLIIKPIFPKTSLFQVSLFYLQPLIEEELSKISRTLKKIKSEPNPSKTLLCIIQLQSLSYTSSHLSLLLSPSPLFLTCLHLLSPSSPKICPLSSPSPTHFLLSHLPFFKHCPSAFYALCSCLRRLPMDTKQQMVEMAVEEVLKVNEEGSLAYQRR